MPPRIRLRSGSDVPSLDIADNDQTLGPAVVHRLFISDHSGDPELLIHRNLRFNSRYYVADRVNDRFVELPYSFCCNDIFSLAVFRNISLCGILRFL